MNFLDDMVARRTARIAAEFGSLSAADRERLALSGRASRPFAAALATRPDVAIIAEVKKCSPSAGPIAPACEASKQALGYEAGGAAAISVLTEPESFGGSFTDLSDVSDAVTIPVLCKDFVVDPVQLFVARGHGADAVLLIVSVLGTRVAEYLDLASTLGLEALVEVHDAAELAVARTAGASLVGVNSRDLYTLHVDPVRARELVRAAAQAGLVVVAESGTTARFDVETASAAGADAVLVGEALMRSPFPEDVLAELVGVRKEKGDVR
ncbi:MAG: indole-3-glycerol phosphate synthase TrpC [Actinomycetia bacterium]|nr:indole-3-glycerol phosphate synthase TrpC [Actinomycetes bacterium]